MGHSKEELEGAKRHIRSAAAAAAGEACTAAISVAADTEAVQHGRGVMSSKQKQMKNLTTCDRLVLTPLSELRKVGDDNMKQYPPEMWSRLLRFQGISVASLCRLRDKVIRSERSGGVLLVETLVPIQFPNPMARGQSYKLLEVGSVIQVKSRRDPERWTGYSYFDEHEFAFPRNAVKIRQRKDWTIEDYCRCVVKPAVMKNQSFFLDELPKEDAGPFGEGFFLSQARSSAFASMCDALAVYFSDQLDLESCYVWLDLVCANQALLAFGDVASEIKADREHVLKHGLHCVINTFNGGCLLFIDRLQKPAALQRAWVIWELLGVIATKSPFSIILPSWESHERFDNVLVQHFDTVLEIIMDVDISKSECYSSEDLEYLRMQWFGYEDRLDSLVRNTLRKWFVEVAKERSNEILSEVKELDETRNPAADTAERYHTACALLSGAGRLLRDMGNYAEAERLHSQVLSLSEKVNGPDHLDTATALTNLAETLRNMGKYQEAEARLRRAVNIVENGLGPNHEQTALILSKLALVLRSLSKYRQSQDIFERVLSICRQVHGWYHKNTAAVLNNLGLVFRKRGNYKRAEGLFRDSLAIETMVHGDNHPATSKVLLNLGETLRNMHRYSDAEHLLRRSLCIRESVLGPNHPQTSINLACLGRVLQALGRYDGVEELFRRSLQIHRIVYPPTHVRVAVSSLRLAEFLHEVVGCTAFQEAEELLRTSLLLTIEGVGPNHPRVADISVSYAKLNVKLGKLSVAKTQLSESRRIYVEHLGDQHAKVAQVDQELLPLLKKPYCK